MRGLKNSICDTCGFESDLKEKESHNKEFHLVHQSIKKQNKRKKAVFGCDKCGVTVDTQRKLRTHKECQHPVETSSSCEPSPPRKKTVKLVEDTSVKEDVVIIEKVEDRGKDVENKVILDKVGVEMVDIKEVEEQTKYEKDEASKKDELIKSQAKQIEDQSKEINSMKETIGALYEARDRKKNRTTKFKMNQNQFQII